MALLLYPCDKYGFLARRGGFPAFFVLQRYTALPA